jgi:membrane protein YqaA with SNARE-associated domain
MRTRILEISGIILIISIALVGAFFLTQYVQDNETAQRLVEQFGYLGILIISIVIGLNLFLPIPAATFAPIFVSAGLPLPGIILMLVLGAMTADAIGYLIGVGGRRITEHTHPAFQAKLQSFATRHHQLVLPFVFLFSAFSPFPNEVILIPLAIMGIRFRVLFLPLLLGTILYESILAYGLTGAFHYFF